MLIGETFNAFVYKIMAAISSGKAHKVATQKVLSSGGISTNNRLTRRRGRENISLIQATKYSSLETSAFLVRASLVARENAVKRESTIHIMKLEVRS
jgi:hydrogenase maturation factor HypF (carbamoyltransferase family)